MEHRVNLDVCGQMFSVPAENIDNGPLSRLTRMCKASTSISKSGRIIIDRPPERFAAILAFYQTGEMHIPMTSCPGAFMNELDYWEISPDVISACCYHRLQSFLDEQETLSAFKERHMRSTEELPEGTTNSKNCVQRVRDKLWETIDYTKPTIIGKIYLFVTFVMVLMSIFILAYSTDPSFKRTMTNCERLEYMASTGTEGYEMIKPYLEELCSERYFPKDPRNLSEKLNLNDTFRLLGVGDENENNDFMTFLFTFVHRIQTEFNISEESGFQNNIKIEEIQQPFYSDYTSQLKDFALDNDTVVRDGIELFNDNGTVRIVVGDEIGSKTSNGTVVTDFELRHESSKNSMGMLSLARLPQVLLELEFKSVNVPNLRIKLFTLFILEFLTNIFFTIEILLRLSTCPNIKFYFLSIINCSDALSLLGAYAYFVLYSMYPRLRYGSWIDYLAYLQMLRSLRLFRMVLSLRAGRVLAYSLRKNIKDLSILVLFLFSGMCTFASCIYIAEDNPNIVSIPDAWYLSVITMTTVGYGDIHPQTKIGRFLCCLCAVSGILLLALTVPIFANHFLMLYNHLESDDVIEKFQKRKQQIKERKQKIMNNKENRKENHNV